MILKSHTNKKYYWVTPTEIINAGQDVDQSITYSSQFIMSGSEVYHPQPRFLRIVASGSLINMYDGSTKQIQDIEVGDVVKSYQPIGMPNTDLNYLHYSTDDLAGSFFSGSVVVDIESFDSYHYYTISCSNGNSYHFHQLGSVFAFDSGSDNYRFIPTYDLQVGDKMFDKDGNEVSITSIDENYSGTIKTFYSLDV